VTIVDTRSGDHMHEGCYYGYCNQKRGMLSGYFIPPNLLTQGNNEKDQ